MGMKYVTAVVEEDGITVDQVFFHDPDGYMVEICNCDNLPMLPISSAATCPLRRPNFTGTPAPQPSTAYGSCGFMEAMMMESLSVDMLNFSF